MIQIFIQKATLKDKPAIYKLDQICFSRASQELLDEIYASDEGNVIYLAEEEEDLLGFLMIYRWDNEKHYIKITNLGWGFRRVIGIEA